MRVVQALTGCAMSFLRTAPAFSKCSVSYVYKSAERGELPCVRVGRMLRFKPDAVRALVLDADADAANR
jgi:excisionase family DNA binding protein